MTLLELRRYLEKLYAAAFGENSEERGSAVNEVSYILCSYFDRSFTWLTTNPELPVSDNDAAALENVIERVKRGEPVQYALGSAPFLGRRFAVDPNVLIPRLDTECLFEEAADRIRTVKASGLTDIRVLDLCTGSGILAVSLKLEFPDVAVTASDVSPEAIKVAKANADNYSCDIDLVLSDLFEALPAGRIYDVIVSNPPYIAEDEYDTIPSEVRDFEPEIALKGGRDGADFYRAIASQAKDHLKPGGWLCFEIGEKQGRLVSDILTRNGFSGVSVTKDVAFMDRVVCGKLPEENI
jgi:release factor glutamine methyltransferase